VRVIKLRRMTAPGPEVASAQTLPPPPAQDAPADSGPVLAPPVTCGPIAASSLGGIPFISVNSPVHHHSGKRLAQFVLGALRELDLTIDVPE
jgi:hypothetical protein